MNAAIRTAPGAALALASAALFGASTPLAKLLLGSVDPWLLAGLLYLGSGIGLALLHGGRIAIGITPTEAPLHRADLPWLAAVVLCGGGIGPVLLMVGLAHTDASSAALLLNLEGVATITIARVAFGENVDRRILLGASAILAGALLLSWKSPVVGIGWGAFAIAGACVAWGIDNNLTRKLSSADPVHIAITKGIVAGAVNLAIALAKGAAMPAAGATLGAGMVTFFRLWRQPCVVRPGAAPSRDGPHWRLLLGCPLHWRSARHHAIRRTDHYPANPRRDAYWHWCISAPDRAARASARAQGGRTRTPPCP